jgi:hypothetical protein
VLLLLDGCAETNAMYLGADTTKTVRLRETVPNAKVWVRDKDGNTLPAVLDLPEGGYFRSDLNR